MKWSEFKRQVDEQLRDRELGDPQIKSINVADANIVILKAVDKNEIEIIGIFVHAI